MFTFSIPLSLSFSLARPLNPITVAVFSVTFGIALQFIVLQEQPGRERENGDPVKRLHAHSSAVCQSEVGFTALMIDILVTA